jgi:hypothetical protein
MALAVRATALGKEGLSLQVHLTRRAVETFRVPVLSQGLHPAISGLNGKLTTKALSLEQGLPVLLAVDVRVLQVKGPGAHRLAAVRAQETLGVKVLIESIHTIPHDGLATLITARSEVLLVVSLTVQGALLLHKAAVHQVSPAVRVSAQKVVRAERLIQRQHKRSSDLYATAATDWDPACARSR